MSRTEKIRQILNGIGSEMGVHVLHVQPAYISGHTAGSTFKQTELEGEQVLRPRCPDCCLHGARSPRDTLMHKRGDFYLFFVKSTFILL